ncbi:rifin PIR protein,putative [Plasmodium sp. DRC-Itaito]|nr:rifin PIR protein,putative [Plasmodium sp. DRC-Itaito]
MKLHYIKILLFVIPLNILLTSYHAHNKNKPSITRHHTTTTTSRVLSEKDIQSSNYDNDADMKSVKENFNRQTSQRFEEYEERMKDKRQKYKQQRDKNIQKIIEKDKREKSLAEKIEKGCLRCGCGLGGVAASVGLFGGLGIYGWKSAATAAAIEEAMVEGLAISKGAGDAAVIEVGKNAVIAGITKEFGVLTLEGQALVSFINPENYTNVANITQAVYKQYQSTCIFDTSGSGARETFCTLMTKKFVAAKKIPEMLQGNAVSHMKVIRTAVGTIVSNAENAAERAADAASKKATTALTTEKISVIDSISSSCQTAVIASVVALLIIVLVMIIIYLVLRYRRKKKMNKKAEYTELLNQ